MDGWQVFTAKATADIALKVDIETDNVMKPMGW